MSGQIVNGVPVAAVSGLVDLVKADGSNGQTKWNAVTTWKGEFNPKVQGYSDQQRQR